MVPSPPERLVLEKETDADAPTPASEIELLLPAAIVGESFAWLAVLPKFPVSETAALFVPTTATVLPKVSVLSGTPATTNESAETEPEAPTAATEIEFAFPPEIVPPNTDAPVPPVTPLTVTVPPALLVPSTVTAPGIRNCSEAVPLNWMSE